MASTLLSLEQIVTRPGAVPLEQDRTRFTVWAPSPKTIDLHIVTPEDRVVHLERDENGIGSVDVEGVSPGARYFFRINGEDRPDPASRYQPEGVHGPSEVVAPPPRNQTRWTPLPLSAYILYELHVGTFTPEGTLDAIIPELKRLKELGITAVELMPVAEFPGTRNWGYDGVFPYSVHHSYGGPEALRRLARACHEHGMALVLDVVYNHLGPEGNYLGEFGPYFSSEYHTPWGNALNFDGPGSNHVRRYFLENALYWADSGIDALRLDAVHAIYDRSAYPFLRQLADAVRDHARAHGRSLHLIAESDLNDSRLVLSSERNGFGLNAQWTDDFHHSLHTLLTGEGTGYYQDFGQLTQMAECLRQGWYYSGRYSPFRRRTHGNSPAQVRARQLIVYSQNHDQIGNRCLGERLIQLAGADAARLAAAVVITSPYIPMLFMGEEYGETAPFLFFVSHSDQQLIRNVCVGRRQEFPEMIADSEFPDPQDENTFLRSKLNAQLLKEPRHSALNRYYTQLIRLRRTHPALNNPSKFGTMVELLGGYETILLRRSRDEQQAVVVLHFGREKRLVRFSLPQGKWFKVIDSADPEWDGMGSALPSELEAGGSELDFSFVPLQAAVFVLRHQ